MNKQDLNGYRKPEDVARRFDLSKIELNSEDIEELKQDVICDDHLSTSSKAPVQNKVITEALNHKVNKVEGKGLSTNDFTNGDKESIHTHDNKSVLDTITQELLNKIGDMDMFYPIGTVYMRIDNADPNQLFLGTQWVLIDDTLVLGNETIYVWKRVQNTENQNVQEEVLE